MLTRCKVAGPSKHVKSILIRALIRAKSSSIIVIHPSTETIHNHTLPSPSSLPVEKRRRSTVREGNEWRSAVDGLCISASTLSLRREGRTRCSRGTIFSSQRSTRSYSTSTTPPQEGSSSSSKPSDNLFDSSHNAWDNVFEGLDDMPPLASTLSRSPRPFAPHNSPSELRTRRQIGRAHV